MSKNEIIACLREASSSLRAEYAVQRMALFGSIVSGEFFPESDVDILVEFSAPIGFRFVQLAEHLEHLLGRKVDLITPEGVRSLRVEEIARSIQENLLYV